MKKLVESPVNGDNFGPFVPSDDQLRPPIQEALKLVGTQATFPRKVLMDMTLHEVVSCWTIACKGPASDPKTTSMARWLHTSFAGIILVHFQLDSIAKRTQGIIPPDWHARPLSELIAHGGRMNEPCTTPEGDPGVQHTLPGIGLRVVVKAQVGRPIWYEKL